MTAKYEPPDCFLLEDHFTDEERLVRDSVRAFVEARVLPLVTDAFREGRFPEELVGELAELGLLGGEIEGHGCAGIGTVAYGLAMAELERADSAVRSFVSAHGDLAMATIHALGSEEQKERWLPEMAAGRKVGCFALTEPDAGSDAGALSTRAEERGGEIVLNGNKMWITNGPIADVAVVWAKDGTGRLQAVLVENDTPGYHPAVERHRWSLRASATAELHLRDCRVPSANRLPATRGMSSLLRVLNRSRVGIAWGVLGAAQACYVEARAYARERVQFGRPIGAFQLVQEKLADMLCGITKGQLLAYHLGRLVEKGRARGHQISMAKRENVAMALDVARSAREILAANGVSDEYQSGRHMVNLESVKTYEGTHDIHTLILGAHVTGMSAFDSAGARRGGQDA